VHAASAEHTPHTPQPFSRSPVQMWTIEAHHGSWRAHLQAWAHGGVTHIRGPGRASRIACEADAEVLTQATTGLRGAALVEAAHRAASQLASERHAVSSPVLGAAMLEFPKLEEPRSQRVEVERLAQVAADAMAAGNEEAALAAVDAFLAHRAPLDECCVKNGNTLLSWAVCAQSLSAVTLLLDHGADPNAPRADGACPLHLAAGYGNVTVMHELITWGANPSSFNQAGFTPLQQVLRLAPNRAVKDGPCNGVVARRTRNAFLLREPCVPRAAQDCRELLLLAGHKETSQDRLAWVRRSAADAAEAEWRARFRCDDQPPPECGQPVFG
jgi:hypothetical protein